MKNNINDHLHRFSKGVIAEGQLYESQAQVRSGHNVDFVTVRGEDVPECISKQILLTAQRTVIAKYAKVLKFWDKVFLTEYPKSNGETYYLLDNQGNAISDFIDPSDKLINGRTLSKGYTVQVFGYRKGSDIPEKISPIHYEFEAYSGILNFKQGFTPTDLKFERISIEAFSYIGKNVKQNFKDVNDLIAMNLMLMQKLTAERIVVQPYTFTTANMTTVWATPRPIPGAFNRFGKQMWCQRFSITIPGYVFEVSSNNMFNNDTTQFAISENGVIVPDMIHTEEGNTIIQIELEVNAGDIPTETGDGKVIMGYKESRDISTGLPKLTLITGDLSFTASTFKRNDGQKLDIKLPIELQGKGSELIPITPQIKKQLLVDQYVVEFTPASVDKLSTELFDKLYQKK